VTAWGVAILVGYGVRLGTTLDRERSAPLVGLPEVKDLAVSQPAVREARPSRLDRALVDALIPDEEGPHGHDWRARIVEEVAAFVRGQLDQLPLRLRALLAVGLLGFRVATVARFGRSLSALSEARRRRWVQAWAYGSWSLPRQLMRAVRSTALVGYYDRATPPPSSRRGSPRGARRGGSDG
jgi:hypothetical protein